MQSRRRPPTEPNSETPKAMVVKVQLSLHPPGGNVCTVYNDDRSVFGLLPTPNDVRHLMRGREKAYFWATMRRGKITLGAKAPTQDW
jgi:hypothetical protein